MLKSLLCMLKDGKQLLIQVFLKVAQLTSISADEVSGKNRGRDVETAGSGNSFNYSPNTGASKYQIGLGTSDGANGGDWFELSNNNRTILFGAGNANPGDFLRILTRMHLQANTAPVARDVTTAVNENAISSTGDVVASSDDADGDALHISKIVYTNASGQIATKSMVANTDYPIHTKYGLLNINSTTGNFTFDAGKTTSTYDSGEQGLSASSTAFFNVNLLDAGDTASETFTYTLSDGTDTDTGTITVNITGINDTPIAVNDQNTITEGGTITRSSTTSDRKELVDNDLDVDGDDYRENFAVVSKKKEMGKSR